MGVISGYPDDTTTTLDDKYLTYDNSGAVKLTSAATLKNYVLPNAGVTAAKIDFSTFGAQSSGVVTSQTTTSLIYTDLATVGPSVTVTVGPSGVLLIGFVATAFQSAAGNFAYASIVMSGANTLAAGDFRLEGLHKYGSDSETDLTRTSLLTGLTPGSTTIKLQYRVNAGTGTFNRRNLWVLPL